MAENARTTARTEYQTPKLVVHGTIDEVTRGGSGPVPDAGQGSAFFN